MSKEDEHNNRMIAKYLKQKLIEAGYTNFEEVSTKTSTSIIVPYTDINEKEKIIKILKGNENDSTGQRNFEDESKKSRKKGRSTTSC